MINDMMCLLCFLVSLKAEIIEQYQLYTTKFKDALFVASVIGYKDDSYSYRMILNLYMQVFNKEGKRKKMSYFI